MRTWTPLLAVAVLVLGGCSAGDDEGDGDGAGPPRADASSSTGAPDGEFTPAPGTPEVAAGEGCAEVRAGIDAFNVGDYDETVARFEAAVPLVEERADGSEASNQLVEAVRWYAELPAEDYPEASATSPDFQRYKAITLGQCIDALLGDPGEPAGSESAEAT